MLIQTIRAVSSIVEAVFGEPPTTKDIDEGLKRPCTFVQPSSISETSTETVRREAYGIDIIRFGDLSYKGYLSLLQAQAALSAALSVPIRTQEGDYIDPGEVETNIHRADMVLIVSFRVESISIVSPDSDAEPMETLQLTERMD